MSERHYVATNWFAQQRRLFIMREMGWLHVHKYVARHRRFINRSLLFSLLIAGIVLVVSLLKYWALLLLLTIIWSVLVVLMTRFVCDKIYRGILVRSHREQQLSFERHHRPLSASSKFPVTPMPATPLIRVLETIDLSTMDVEKFIENEANLQALKQASNVHDTQHLV